MPQLLEEDFLKLRLLADGIRVDAGAADAWRERFGGPLTLAEYATTSGIALVLPRDVYVNAPLSELPNVPVLRHDDGAFFVDDAGSPVAVDVIPVPAFHEDTYEDAGLTYPLTNLGVTHTDRCRVSPIEGCSMRCKFCDLPFEFKYRRKEREQLLELIRVAADDPLAPARHVLISGGTPAAKHEAWMDDVFAYLAEHSPLPVDVMMTPRADLGHPAWLRSIGVNMLSINLEVSDPERAKVIVPQKARRIGRDHTMDYIERAVEAFGVGGVQSLVVFGAAIEPIEATLTGVRDLAERGCTPVLSAFRPHHLTPLADAPAATLDEMLRVYEGTLEICERAGTGVLPGPRCIPCQHNTVAFPIEGDFYVGLDGDLTARCPTC